MEIKQETSEPTSPVEIRLSQTISAKEYQKLQSSDSWTSGWIELPEIGKAKIRLSKIENPKVKTIKPGDWRRLEIELDPEDPKNDIACSVTTRPSASVTYRADLERPDGKTLTYRSWRQEFVNQEGKVGYSENPNPFLTKIKPFENLKNLNIQFIKERE